MEVPTIYKAYIRPKFQGISPQNMALYGTVPPFSEFPLTLSLFQGVSVGLKHNALSLVVMHHDVQAARQFLFSLGDALQMHSTKFLSPANHALCRNVGFGWW